MPRIKEGFKGERAIVLPAFLIEELKQNPLGKELYITDIGYYPHAGFHYRERSQEEATEFVLIYCVEGEGWFETDSCKYTVGANQFFILPEQKAHRYGSNEKKLGASIGYISMEQKPLFSVWDLTVPPILLPKKIHVSKKGCSYSKKFIHL